MYKDEYDDEDTADDKIDIDAVNKLLSQKKQKQKETASANIGKKTDSKNAVSRVLRVFGLRGTMVGLWIWFANSWCLSVTNDRFTYCRKFPQSLQFNRAYVM